MGVRNHTTEKKSAATGKELVKVPDPNQVRFDRRKTLMPAVYNMCDIFGAPYPGKDSLSEKMLVELAPHWLELQKKTAKEMVDGALLPALVEKTIDANIPRAALWREKVRHIADTIFGGVASFIGQALVSILVAFLEIMVLAMEKLAIVIVPFVLVFLGYCLIGLLSQPGQWTAEMIGSVLLPGFVCGVAASGLATTIYVLIEVHKRQKQRKDIVLTEKWGGAPEKLEGY